MKVKISPIGALDMLKFKNMDRERDRMIAQGATTPLPGTDSVNELAQTLHPQIQYLVIQDLWEENPETRTFVLAPNPERGTQRLAPFQAGSALNISFWIGESVASRVYSISSSPSSPLYHITVKKKADGWVSSYLVEHGKVGDELVATEPFGCLTYSSLRDEHTVVAIGGGTGITPFYSMAQAIGEGVEHFRLILLYAARTREDLLFQKQFAELMEKTPEIQVHYILSREQVEGYGYGHVTPEVIQSYLPQEPYSVFVAGANAFCANAVQSLQKLSPVPAKIRVEHTPSAAPEAPQQTYQLTIHWKGQEQTIPLSSQETVLSALERSGIPAKNKCRSGSCGFCRSRLIQGKYQSTQGERLRMADETFGYFHPCCAYPRSDMEIELY